MTTASDHARSLLLFSFEQTAHIFGVEELGLRIGQALHADPVLRDVWLRGEVTNVTRSAGRPLLLLDQGRDRPAALRALSRQRAALDAASRPTAWRWSPTARSASTSAREAASWSPTSCFPKASAWPACGSKRCATAARSRGAVRADAQAPLAALPAPDRRHLLGSRRRHPRHLSVLERRYPLAEVVFLAAPVQGAGASEALALALQRLATWTAPRSRDGVDLIILARGGGSAEDLTVFNDERLVRAIFACPVPVVSAVGHETNLTLADLVADVRAPTPSAAAELASPDLDAVRREVAHIDERAGAAVRARLVDTNGQLRAARRGLAAQLGHQVSLARARLAGSRAQLEALSPAATLARGFAVAEVEGHALLQMRARSSPAPTWWSGCTAVG